MYVRWESQKCGAVIFFPKRYAAHIELHVRSSAPKVRSKINNGEESPMTTKRNEEHVFGETLLTCT